LGERVWAANDCAASAAVVASGDAAGCRHMVGGWSGGMPGRQTVPRSELRPWVEFLRRTRGDGVYHSDHANLTERHHAASVNADLWAEAEVAQARRPGRASVRWIRAHRLEREKLDWDLLSEHDVRDIIGNAYADAVADAQADELRLSPEVSQRYDEAPNAGGGYSLSAGRSALGITQEAEAPTRTAGGASQALPATAPPERSRRH